MKSILLLLCCLGVANAAELPFCSLTPDGSRLAVEPCRKAPQKMPRRSVMQVIERMPWQKPLSYGPPYTPAPLVTAPLPAPVPLVSCSAGSCRDGVGVLHVTGVDRNGKLCTQNGAFLQCF